MKDIVDLLGRFFLALLFFFEAYNAIAHFQTVQASMTLYGLTWRQDLLLIGAIVCMVLGSVLVLIGYRAGFGAFLLFCYWLPVAFIVHPFWAFPKGEQAVQMEWLFKDLAIGGGLLMVVVSGAGKYSVKRLFSTFKVKGA